MLIVFKSVVICQYHLLLCKPSHYLKLIEYKRVFYQPKSICIFYNLFVVKNDCHILNGIISLVSSSKQEFKIFLIATDINIF